MNGIRISTPLKSDDFSAYFQLRWQLLRAPWGQPCGSERDDKDKTAHHLMALDQQQIVGVGRLHLIDKITAQIRYMAVREEFQRQGIGSQILAALEHKAGSMGCQRIILDARELATDFYLNKGYEITGEGHMLFGEIKHKKMCKRI